MRNSTNRKWYWWVPSLLIVAIGAAPVVHSEGRWKDVAPGFQLYEGTFQGSARSATTRIVAVRLDTKRYLIRVVDAAQPEAGSASSAKQSNYADGTLRGLLHAPKVAAAINGGFITSYAFPQPLGLARIASKTLAPVGTGPLLSGFLCITARGVVRIERISQWPAAECRDALQAGPLIIEPKEQKGITEYEAKRTPFIRSVVCTDDDSVLFVRSEQTALFNLMNVLLQEQRAQGLGCNVALNLGGESDSGILWRSDTEVRSEGSLDATLATAIVAYKR